MKPTSGPWRYEEGTRTIRSVPTNYWIATMDSFEGAVHHQANSRLIASAPDLLFALEYLTKYVEQRQAEEGGLEAYLKYAHEAAAKATGELL